MNRTGVRFLILALLCFSAAGMVSGRSSAQDATPAPGGMTILPPDALVGGATLGEWSGRWWQWAVSIPEAANPNFDETAGGKCGYGQHGPVFFLPGSFTPDPPEVITCVVPAGVAIYAGFGGAECSPVEPPPFFGRDEAELAACAAANTATMTVTATIDGQEIPDLDRYLSTSPIFTMNLPEDNFFGVPAGPAQAVAVGYGVILAPPPPGEYVIDGSADFGDGSPPLAATIRVVVQEPAVVEPAATPEAEETPDA
jgi:hypothetical protein